MNKRISLYIAGLTICAILIVAILLGTVKAPNVKANNFTRKFWKNGISLIARKELKDIRDICCYEDGQLYLSFPQPGYVTILDSGLNSIGSLFLKTGEERVLRSFFTTKKNGPEITIYGNNLRKIFIWNHRLRDARTISVGEVFSKALRITPGSIILRGPDSTFQTQVFKKIDASNGDILCRKSLRQWVGDSTASLDGGLYYDDLNHLIVYSFFYSSRLLLLDTNLNLVREEMTIEHRGKFTSHLKTIKSEFRKVQTMAAPPAYVKYDCAVDNGKVYVKSAMKSDNESSRLFNGNTVIDVYEIAQKKYAGSFYVPAYGKEKLSRFAVRGSKLIGVYKNGIAVYALGHP